MKLGGRLRGGVAGSEEELGRGTRRAWAKMTKGKLPAMAHRREEERSVG
jgi:hypothetical protein